MAGTRLGKYELRGVLGRGAAGTVHDAWDPVIARRVAIKTVRLGGAGDAEGGDAEGGDSIARFRREAQAAGRLSHPNIVSVYDYGETEDQAFIVMELVDGHSLRELLDSQERLPLGTTLHIMGEVLAGLAYSHGRGVVHRDIKPSNIILTGDGQAKIADFGIARIESSGLTQMGTMMGTPAYMSPEQFNAATVDLRTDIYSCGVLLYQLLSGERPFDGGFAAIMHKALTTTPPPPSEMSVSAPPVLDAVVARAMARRPEDRFQSAADFAVALRRAPLGPVAADADATVVRTPSQAAIADEPAAAVTRPPAPSRLRARVVAGAVFGIAALGGAAAYLAVHGTPRHGADPPASRATSPEAVASRTPQIPAPPSTPTPQPPPPPPPPAPPPPAPPPSPEALAAALASIDCALARAETAAGTVIVSGMAGRGATPSLHDAVRRAAPDMPVDWRTVALDQSYCPILDTLRPAASRAEPQAISMQLANNAARLHNFAPIVVEVAMPDFPARLTLDDFEGDGLVYHMVVPRMGVGPIYHPGDRAVLRNKGWVVGPPFGQELIVAVASTAPLFPLARPATEPAATYLASLGAALDTAARHDGHLAVAALTFATTDP